MCGLCDASNRHVGRYPDLHNTDAHALLRDAIEDLCGVVIETSFGYLRSAIIQEVQPLQTARLSLRVPELADAEPLMDIFWDPEVVAKKQVTLTEPPGDLELARRQTAGMIHHWELLGYGLWIVNESATQQVIGAVGLQKWKNWPGVELAWLLHRSRWGHGFATEAARAALQWTWDITKVDHVISLIEPDDPRSIRVATKVGEQFERADSDPIHGEPVHIYGISRPERH